MSDTIRVRSVLGRFLEHSRIYRFGDDPDDEIWIGSADMMHRNLDRRVEVLVRVMDPGLRGRLRDILSLAMSDTDTSWGLQPDATWVPVRPAGRRISMQEKLMANDVSGARLDA